MDIVLAVVPTQAFREVARAARPFARAGTPWVICAKGIERASKRFLNDVLTAEIPEAISAILSGPSFAADVARGLPTAVTVAAQDEDIAEQIAERLATPSFRLYRSTDVRGVEIGGAAKNVLAIACGIAGGAGLGASAVAALIARGFAELARFGRALDARPETLMGLSGLGDLVLSCSSEQSRNFSYGLALGRGEAPQTASHGNLVEGAFTASVLIELARERGVDIPISECVAGVVAGELQINQAIEALLQRPAKSEL
jgi:glycerol-3-phosphate dehydrogenase (NAD(P)+)